MSITWAKGSASTFVVAAACIVLAFVGAQVHSAFMVLIAVPIAAIWLLAVAYIAWRDPTRRRRLLIQVGLVVVTSAGIVAIQFYYATSARAAANDALQLVRDYKGKYGHYPDTLEEAGAKVGPYGGRWRLIYAREQNGAPTLMYPVTWVIFDMYDYNFESGQWIYLAD
jgi:hypothetical protein